MVTLAQAQMPQMVTENGRTRLYVDGRPFVMLAGELHNSSTGSLTRMAPIWQRMKAQHLNTVIAAVTWETIEPREGEYDFRLLDGMIRGAREAGLRLVLLWFGSWKNGISTYVPEWVKLNQRRFPLAEAENGQKILALSALGQESMKADARAFGRMMSHLKEVDGEQHTVIMVQIENEIGTLGTRGLRCQRDFSPLAEKAFRGQVPRELMAYLKANKSRLHKAVSDAWTANGSRLNGTWEEVFGRGQDIRTDNWQDTYPFLTEELFNAWNYATYVETLARAGKAIYPLPLYVNAWLKQPEGRVPGEYPSGAPIPHVFDVWRAAAPHVDFFAPDIYAIDVFDWVCQTWKRDGNPLFIPETSANADGASRAFYTFGRYGAIGYAPFGIDGGAGLLTISDGDQSFRKAYGLLRHLTDYLNKYGDTADMKGILTGRGREVEVADWGDYALRFSSTMQYNAFELIGVNVENAQQGSEDVPVSGALIVRLAKNEFLVAGGINGLYISVEKGSRSKAGNVGLLAVDELLFDEQGHAERHRLNGDEIYLGGPELQPGEARAFIIKTYDY